MKTGGGGGSRHSFWSHAFGVAIHPLVLVYNVTLSGNNNEFNAVLCTDEDIGGVPCMQYRFSAKMKRYGICMEEREVHFIKVHRSKSEKTLCRLLIIMAEETF